MKTNMLADVKPFVTRGAIYNGTDGKKKIRVRLTIEAAIPICITQDDKISELTLSTDNVTVTSDNTTKLVDPVYEANNENKERYIFMGALKSPLTKNVIYMYYDNMYNDIIITPDLSFLDLASPNSNFYDVRCYNLGIGEELLSNNKEGTLPPSLSKHYNLPEPNTKLALDTHLVTLPSYGFFTTDNGQGGFEETISSKFILRHNNRRVGTLVNLGPITKIFKTSDRLPLYLLYQYGIVDYGLKYISVVDPDKKNLWLPINF